MNKASVHFSVASPTYFNAFFDIFKDILKYILQRHVMWFSCSKMKHAGHPGGIREVTVYLMNGRQKLTVQAKRSRGNVNLS